jgi:GTP-binding protein
MNVKSVDFVIGVASPSQLPRTTHAEIAWAGRSNVGKSSLINKVIGRRGIARTSNTPGKTRQINFFRMNNTWHLVDLPGYGFARGPAVERESWRKLIEPYLTERRQLAAVAVLVDARRGLSPLDVMMFEWLTNTGRSWAVILTKIDKISGNDRKKVELEVREQVDDNIPLFSCSAKTGRGVDSVRNWIDARLTAWDHRADGLLDWQINPVGE